MLRGLMSGLRSQVTTKARAHLQSPWNRLWPCLLALLWLTPGAHAATGTLLENGTLYPRVVRLEHGAPGHNGTLIASTNGNIFRSTDDGASFSFVDTVPVISGSQEYCCATLYEMPQRVGKLHPGTLVFAATYYIGDSRAIEIYTSTDEGKHWRYSATPVSGGDPTHGLWEPQFTVATDGALVMFWSDETDPCCSQKLAQSRTYDGENWQDQTNTVASLIPADRPGMAVVTQLPSGLYFMSYELCGPAACTVFYRTSTDGWSFGAPDNTGTKVQTASGQYFEHAPTSTWSPSVISDNGSILLVGQVLYDGDGAVSANNGKVLFVNNTADGSGPWYAITAPVQVPGAYDNYCPNYASPLLPSVDGKTILEMASDYDTSTGLCMTYFASERWNSLPASGASYTFSNQQSNLCLDDLGWGTTNGTVADEWSCTGLAVQQWTVRALGGGYFHVQNVYSGLCLDNRGASTTPGNLMTLWVCSGSPSQSWLFMDLGNEQFKLQSRASGSLMLDDPGGSATPGTQLQVWTDNGLDPQHWVLQH